MSFSILLSDKIDPVNTDWLIVIVVIIFFILCSIKSLNSENDNH